jgi:hypothetical protein
MGARYPATRRRAAARDFQLGVQLRRHRSQVGRPRQSAPPLDAASTGILPTRSRADLMLGRHPGRRAREPLRRRAPPSVQLPRERRAATRVAWCSMRRMRIMARSDPARAAHVRCWQVLVTPRWLGGWRYTATVVARFATTTGTCVGTKRGVASLAIPGRSRLAGLDHRCCRRPASTTLAVR